MIDMRRVRYFLALSETMNVSDTARRLGISQPALTKSLLRLEADVGGALIRRERRHTHLTPLGRALLDQFRSLDAAVRQTEQRAQELTRWRQPSLDIALMCTIGPGRLTRFLQSFTDACPDIPLVLSDGRPDALFDRLLGGEIDCAIVATELGDQSRLRTLHLYSERLVVIFPPNHRFASASSLSLSRVLEEPFLDRLHCEFHQMLGGDDAIADHGTRVMVSCEREEWIQCLVRAGLGVSIVPEESIVVDGLAHTGLDEPRFSRDVSLVIPTGREDTVAVQSFMGHARGFDWHGVGA